MNQEFSIIYIFYFVRLKQQVVLCFGRFGSENKIACYLSIKDAISHANNPTMSIIFYLLCEAFWTLKGKKKPTWNELSRRATPGYTSEYTLKLRNLKLNATAHKRKIKRNLYHTSPSIASAEVVLYLLSEFTSFR